MVYNDNRFQIKYTAICYNYNTLLVITSETIVLLITL